MSQALTPMGKQTKEALREQVKALARWQRKALHYIEASQTLVRAATRQGDPEGDWLRMRAAALVEDAP